MGNDISWLAQAGLDTQTGIGYTGGQDKYLSAINRFYSNYTKNRDKIIEYRSAGDYENYMITVHALKSNSKMIGASALGSAFEALENAARNGDVQKIESDTDNALSMYKDLIEALKPIEQMGDVTTADEISGKVAKETADALLAALDDFDDELSKELIKKLAGYPFRITQKNRLKEASDLVEDFMYEDAAEIIREIMPSIE
jgi:HPt (histidine-containing phosphotransfer) domain-containing protein